MLTKARVHGTPLLDFSYAPVHRVATPPLPRTVMQPVILRPTRTQMQVRFADTDMLGHINNLSYSAYAEVGRTHFFQRIGPDVPWFVLARMELDYRKEGYLSDELSVLTSVERMGSTSLTLRQDIVRGEEDELIVASRAVLVCIDRESRAKMQLPSHWQLPADDVPPQRLFFDTSET